MSEFNKEVADKDFYLGKSFLDSGQFGSAIKIYDTIIARYEQFTSTEDGRILIETSLNNRGSAKCQLGELNADKQLYLSGMDDFEKSIALDDATTEKEKECLTAYKNLQKAKVLLDTIGDSSVGRKLGSSNYQSF